MERLKINKNSIFVLETDGTLSENEKNAILNRWYEVVPSHKLMIVKKGSIKILEIDNERDDEAPSQVP